MAAHLLSMPTIRSQLPYKTNPDTQARIQAYVDREDKNTLLASMAGDDSIIAFLVQNTFIRTVAFIRQNNLNVYSPSNIERVLTFIRNGSDPCPPGQADAHDDNGRGKNRKPKIKAVSHSATAATQIHS